MNGDRPSLDAWLSEIKAEAGSDGIGIFLMHNGVVRATSKGEGCVVCGLELGYDPERLATVIAQTESFPGVAAVRVWINEGRLAVGDEMILALVAGDLRANVQPAWTTLVTTIMAEVVTKRDILV